MGQILSCVALGASWCVCTAAGSLLSACCGNDKASTVAPSANSGRKRSVFLMVLAMIISFVFQYWVAPAVVETTSSSNSSGSLPTSTSELADAATEVAKDQATHLFKDSWLDGCEYESLELRERCVGNSGVYRATSTATLFFLLAAIAVKLKPSFNREVWVAKYVIFLCLAAATIFIPNEPIFNDVYLNIARIGGAFFILFQSVVFLDMAYNINDSFVERSNKAEAEEAGSGTKWLAVIILACAILFLGSLTAIGLMFYFFGGCAISNAFVSLTLVLSVVLTLAQLTGENGSLLSSAITCAYATYLCFSSLSRNPNEECNPKLGEEDFTGIVLGVGLTMISLGWTGWSYTASKATKEEDSVILTVYGAEAGGASSAKGEERKVNGVVTGTTSYGTSEDEGEAPDTKQYTTEEESNKGFSNSWKLNLVLALISCWFAMAVTSWGSIESGGDRANPEVGKVSMWMLIASQWLFMALYLWTLVAPRLFPDRDFS